MTETFVAVVTYSLIILSDGVHAVTHKRFIFGGSGADGDWSEAENEHGYLLSEIIQARHHAGAWPQARHATERAIWSALLDQARTTGTAHWTGSRPPSR